MIRLKTKQDAIARLTAARNEIEEVLRGSVPSARYDPDLLRSVTRSELTNLCSGLTRIIGDLQAEQ